MHVYMLNVVYLRVCLLQLSMRFESEFNLIYFIFFIPMTTKALMLQ